MDQTPPQARSESRNAEEWQGSGEKARKACLTCRRQKMRCIPGQGQACRRCERAQVPCVFIPRANAAHPQTARLIDTPVSRPDEAALPREAAILRRLDRIESLIGLSEPITPAQEEGAELDGEPDDPARSSLWATARVLQARCPERSNVAAWKRSTIKQLWQSYYQSMPALHFMPEKQVFNSTLPILMAAILSHTSSRGSEDVAIHFPVYYSALCAEISALVNPAHDDAQGEEASFQKILAITYAALLSEGHCKITGLWISVAYRILLEQCPPRASPQWQQMFCGLQIIDLEHCSLHLTCPGIPFETTLSATRATDDQLSPLSRMMHVGLTHFSGRGLPTIWSYVSNTHRTAVSELAPFTGVDAAVIRDWARQLDAWLAHFSIGPFENVTDRTAVYRQYVMHRLCVLSIYLPSRRYDLFSSDATPEERHELLESARTTIKLHAQDTSIWSNWDLIMITWAALIVLQAVKGKYGQLADLEAIRLHLHLLRQTHEPGPNLREMLAARLEEEMRDVREEDVRPVVAVLDPENAHLRYPWALFEESSLQAVDQWIPIAGPPEGYGV